MAVDPKGGVHGVWKTSQRPGRYHHCKAGGSLAGGSPQDTTPPPGEKTVSFGDLYLDGTGRVHHVFITYPSLGIWYVTKAPAGGAFGGQQRIGRCNNDEHQGYENPWPAIGVGALGAVVVAWAENRGSKAASYRVLAVRGKGGWSVETLRRDASIGREGKPAIAVAAGEVYLLWPDSKGELEMAVLSFGKKR